MQVVEPLRQVSAKLLDRWLGELLVLLDHLEQVTASAVFEDDPEVIARLIPVVELQYVSVLEIVENSNLKGNVSSEF